ncbi:MAG: hypothetical protein BGP24_17925 [Lysobacterales bacterium 69-70]|nr:hypothetical protein [Xanthomonadaceae bacterium]ODU32659.1 MAG: hypothetical protein ABS97_15085 [Xanthomonadaceae bacterium SCN 69-320]ODV19170.1 MAG: hypothetical protein ABT27_11600 [Xanthomonadaceae bacterium SCN 69-25]OJY99651.1 MAG: hypothetical protein BGP24_17925 [Xanthomonadales bacterium 69-70]
MKKISSDSTWFYKKVFPAMWFGLLAAFFVVSVTGNGLSTGGWKFLLMPCLMAIVGFFVMKNVVWDLVDEVHDCGDSLLVRNGSEEERIPLSNIINVNASTQTRPPRITLRLARPGRFGSQVAFSPPSKISFNPFALNPVAEDLIVRVDQARLKRSD